MGERLHPSLCATYSTCSRPHPAALRMRCRGQLEVLATASVLLYNDRGGKKKKREPELSFLPYVPLTITVGDFTSCKEPRDGACVSVPSPLHPSACTQGHSGLCARPSLRLTLGGTLMDFCFRRSSISLSPPSPLQPPLHPFSLSLSPSISFFLSHIPTHTHTHSLSPPRCFSFPLLQI